MEVKCVIVVNKLVELDRMCLKKTRLINIMSKPNQIGFMMFLMRVLELVLRYWNWVLWIEILIEWGIR